MVGLQSLKVSPQIKFQAAFKEWNSVIEALGSGEQIIILRKGGIIEDEGDFVPKEKFFFLFPTKTHEKPELLKKTFPQDNLGENEIKIKYWAEVVLARKIKNKEILKKIDDFHIWKYEVVEERFHRWQNDEVWALVVRVFKLKNPVIINNHPDYAGCKSWIEIKDEIDITQSEPVLSDEEFEKKLNLLKEILEE
jgi:hypothetical protein